MKYRNVVVGIGIALSVLLALLATAILWRDSEQEYVAMTNLGLRLKVLRQSVLNPGLPDQENLHTFRTIWRPMITAMQIEARHALRTPGLHASSQLHEQLAQFSETTLNDEADWKSMLSRLDFPESVIEPRLPIVFSEKEQLASLSTVNEFQKEILLASSSESAYTSWLSPILQQQQAHDRSVLCKTRAEIEAFQMFSDKLQSKCASTRNKWTACSGKNESIARQMKELQMTFDTSLAKYKSRWTVKDVENLCRAAS